MDPEASPSTRMEGLVAPSSITGTPVTITTYSSNKIKTKLKPNRNTQDGKSHK